LKGEKGGEIRRSIFKRRKKKIIYRVGGELEIGGGEENN